MLGEQDWYFLETDGNRKQKNFLGLTKLFVIFSILVLFLTFTKMLNFVTERESQHYMYTVSEKKNPDPCYLLQ